MNNLILYHHHHHYKRNAIIASLTILMEKGGLEFVHSILEISEISLR